MSYLAELGATETTTGLINRFNRLKETFLSLSPQIYSASNKAIALNIEKRINTFNQGWMPLIQKGESLDKAEESLAGTESLLRQLQAKPETKPNAVPDTVVSNTSTWLIGAAVLGVGIYFLMNRSSYSNPDKTEYGMSGKYFPKPKAKSKWEVACERYGLDPKKTSYLEIARAKHGSDISFSGLKYMYGPQWTKWALE